MHSHGNSQAKAQVDAEVLSERPLSRHHLRHRAQAKRLHTDCQNYQNYKMVNFSLVLRFSIRLFGRRLAPKQLSYSFETHAVKDLVDLGFEPRSLGLGVRSTDLLDSRFKNLESSRLVLK